MKYLRLLLILPLLLCTGCTDNYAAALKAGDTIATGINQSMSTIDTFRIQGSISPAEETNILGYLKFANDADGAFVACASNVHANIGAATTYTTCAQTFLLTLDTPSELALIKVSNPTGASAVSTIVQGVITGVNSVIAAFGGK